MPYPLSAFAANKITSKDDVSLTTFIEIIKPGGGTLRYSTVELFGAKKGLQQNGPVYEQFNGAGSGGSVNISIFDADGTLLSQLKNSNLINAKVDYYIIFETGSWNDKILIFSGKLDSPFSWSENSRMVTFNVVKNGIDGVITAPAVLGDVKGVPNTEDTTDMTTTEAMYVKTTGKKRRGGWNTVDVKSDCTVSKMPPESLINNPRGYIIGGVNCYGTFTDDQKWIGALNLDNGDHINITGRDEEDTDHNNPTTLWLQGEFNHLAGKFIKLKVKVEAIVFKAARPTNVDEATFDGNYFLLNEDDPMLNGTTIGGIKFESMSVGSTTLPTENASVKNKLLSLGNKPKKTTRRFDFVCQVSSVSGNKLKIDNAPHDEWGEPILLDGDNCRLNAIYAKYPLQAVGEMDGDYAESWYLNAGSKIEMPPANENYLVSNIGGTVINAYDKDMVTKEFTSSGTPLRCSTGKYWDVISETGNTVTSILEYLITHYTELAFECSSAIINTHASLQCGLYIASDTDVVTVIDDICMQACLGYSINANIFTVLDLAANVSALPTELTLTNEWIELGSLALKINKSRSLSTLINGKYKPDMYPKTEEITITAENNVSTFGKKEKTINYTMYHAAGSVQRSVDFYIDLLSNIWKELPCRCFLRGLPMYLNEKVNVTTDTLGTVSGLIKNYTFTPYSSSITLDLKDSPTGGTGYLSGTYDGTYDMPTHTVGLDIDGEEEVNVQTQEKTGSSEFIPVMVPMERYSFNNQFKTQKGLFDMEITAVYPNCLVAKIVTKAPKKKHFDLGKVYQSFYNENPMEKEHILAYPDGADIVSRTMRALNSVKDEEGFSQSDFKGYLYTSGLQLLHYKEGYSSIVPAIKIGDMVKCMMNPMGVYIWKLDNLSIKHLMGETALKLDSMTYYQVASTFSSDAFNEDEPNWTEDDDYVKFAGTGGSGSA